MRLSYYRLKLLPQLEVILWSADLLLYCYVIKTKRRTTCSQVSQPASAGKGTNMSELQARHWMTPEHRRNQGDLRRHAPPQKNF